jgi:hypothetical protein
LETSSSFKLPAKVQEICGKKSEMRNTPSQESLEDCRDSMASYKHGRIIKYLYEYFDRLQELGGGGRSERYGIVEGADLGVESR